ncbi:SMI1/KNR4 family protein [Aliarcobacter cryaerophilus]|uniref:SMI1/KNR4 family protein n=1 Tax=Aliarcobacter cryaerophilus TaxID=28198 RepID=UPI00082963A5|nr:SMI1/KNR4 family protein [Aliarcobacter cryaerophilus]
MKKVQEYILKNKSDFILKENQSKEIIANAENRLGFKFDDDYFEYLNKFGIISYKSVEIFGLGVNENSHLNVIKNTIEIKDEDNNFPNDSVILEYVGELNYIIYTMNRGVFQYTKNSLSVVSNTLEEYLLMRFKEAL